MLSNIVIFFMLVACASDFLKTVLQSRKITIYPFAPRPSHTYVASFEVSSS